MLLVGATLMFATGGQEGAAAIAGVAVSPPGQLPIVKEKVTLTAFIPSPGFIQGLKTNASAVWLESVTNVHVEWLESSTVDAKTKLSILLAGGDYPDMLVGTGQNGAGLSVQDVHRYGTQGVFIPLNDLIEKNGFYVKELFRAEPVVKGAITSPNGKIYGLPAVFTDDYHMTMRQKLWIDKDRLQRLGLKMPATTDDLYAVAKAFKEKLIDVAALTQDKEQIKPLVDGGTANRVGMAASHHPGNFASMTETTDAARYRQFVAVPPIEGPKGNQTTAWIIDRVIGPGQFEITSKCKYPEVAYRWADTMFSLDFAMHEKGIEGVHWPKVAASENLMGLNGKPATYKLEKVLAKEDNAQINLGHGWTRNLKNEAAEGAGYSYEEMLCNQTLLYEPYKVARFPHATASIAEADGQEFNDLRRTIHTYVAESVDRFIIGDMDIEKQWDSYVSQLNQIGLPRYLKILEASLAAQ